MDLKLDLTPILIVSIVFLTSAVVVGTVLYFVHRARELKHQTIRLALEKGQPLPPGLLADARASRPVNDLARGVKLVFLGVGLSAFFWFSHPHLWSAGLIPLFIGVGYLVAHLLTGRARPGSPAAG
jgi:hypothetical protein